MELQFLSNKTEDAVSGVLLCFVNILVVCMYNPVVKRVSDVERFLKNFLAGESVVWDVTIVYLPMLEICRKQQ